MDFMKKRFKFKLAGALLAIIPMIFVASQLVQALAPYIEPGNIYRVRNITDNPLGDYMDPASADKCEKLQYQVRIHNPGEEPLRNVTVQAGFQSAAATQNISTVVIRADNASPSNTSDTATVNLSTAQKVTYDVGSTELLDANGVVIDDSMPDVTAGSGVPIGNVGVSVNEKRFVRFTATVDCPQPPQPSFSCDALDVEKLSRTSFRFTGRGSATNATITGYQFSLGNAVVQDTASNIYTLNQTTPGSYTVSLVVKTDKGNTAPSAVCTKTVTVEDENVPVFACDALDVTKLNRTSFRFTARGTATNATITGYQFSLNGQTVQDNASNIYNFSSTTPGDYTVAVTVKTDHGNTAPSAVCTKTVTVEEEVNPAFRCDALDVTKLSRTSFRFTGRGSATNATITGYIFSVGNTVAQDSASNIYTLNQATSGSYTVRLIVKTDQGNTAPTAACTKTVVVEAPPCENNPNTPEDECNPCVNNPTTPEDECHPCVNNPATPMDECNPCVNNPSTPMDECNPIVPPPTPTPPSSTVTVLPNTGPGEIAGLFAAVIAAGTFAHAFVYTRLSRFFS